MPRKTWLFPTASIVGFGREAGYGPVDHSAGLGVVSGALLLGRNGFVQIN
jgi:hypothetical protein